MSQATCNVFPRTFKRFDFEGVGNQKSPQGNFEDTFQTCEWRKVLSFVIKLVIITGE